MTRLALALVALLPMSALAAGDSYSMEEVLSRMSSASKRFETLTARLVQEKSYPQLGIADPPEVGSLAMTRKSQELRLRLDIITPEPRTVVVEGNSYIYYQPKLKQAIVGSLEGVGSGQGAGFLRYLLGDLEGARDEYDIELGGTTEDGTLHLTLVPRSPEKAYYKRVELWVDTDLWLPVRQELTELNQSVTKIRLDDLSIDVELSDELFELALPDDVKRLKG